MPKAAPPASLPEMTIRMRSVDGSVYWITSHSTVDYILNPEFLKFLLVCCTLYAVLDGGRDLPGLTIWLLLMHWAIVILAIIAWLVLSGGIIRFLLQKRVIRQVWTPVLLAPMMAVTEAAVQFSLWLFDLLPMKPWAATTTDVTRDIIVVLLLDYLHGQFVVARHPQARLPSTLVSENNEPLPHQVEPVASSNAGLAGPAAIIAAPEPDPLPALIPATAPQATAPSVEPPPMARPGSVRIGSETFVLSDILIIRIEDHYLSITTRAGRSLQRAKLSSIPDLHQGDLGIQVNRSAWIAFRAIRQVQPMANGQMLLIMENDEEEFVAKPRVHAFRHSYRLALGME